MKWMLLIVGVVLGASLLILLIGVLLPVKHVASRTQTFHAPPDHVWKTITSLSELTQWRKDLKRVEVLPDRNGLPSWKETDSHGNIIPFEVLESVPSQRLVAKIVDPALPFGGTWTYELRPTPDGSALTITENGEVYNPIFRFVSRFVMGHTRTMDDYLAALKARLEKAA